MKKKQKTNELIFRKRINKVHTHKGTVEQGLTIIYKTSRKVCNQKIVFHLH